MWLDYFSDFIVGFSIVNGVIIAILLVLATQYKYFFQKSTKEVKTTQAPTITTNECSNVQKSTATDQQITLQKIGSCEKRLTKIANCALKLQNYKPLEEAASGDSAAFLLKQQIKKSHHSYSKLDTLSTDTESINDADSMVVNVPSENDQDDIDISDLTPDDITVNNDVEDEEENANISPQAIADLEAEHLDGVTSNRYSDEEFRYGFTENSYNGLSADSTNKERKKILCQAVSEGSKALMNHFDDNGGCDLDDKSSLGSKTPSGVGKVVSLECQHMFKAAGFVNRCSSLEQNFLESVVGKEVGRDQFGYFFEELDAVEGGYVMKLPAVGSSNDNSTENEQSNIKLLYEQRSASSIRVSTGCNLEFPLQEDKPASSFTNSTKELKDLPLNIKASDIYKESSVEIAAHHLSRQALLGALEETEFKQHYGEKLGAPALNSVAYAKMRSERENLTEEELAQERLIQEKQLSEILALMERNPEMFGHVTKGSVTDQTGLYYK